MCVLKSREVFTDTCFSHCYVTLFPSGVASFWYMLLFFSDHCTIPLVLGSLQSSENLERHGKLKFSLKSLKTPNLYSQEGRPVPIGNCPGNGQHGGDCGALWILSKVKCYSDISVPPWCPFPVCGKCVLRRQLPWARLCLSGNAILRALCLESSRSKELI